ncbi:MAG: hypothetical protein IT288_06345 [Bdellovibrionales bacterium]|nr:hypothetical protein [Bdellovibrionales bacterium]
MVLRAVFAVILNGVLGAHLALAQVDPSSATLLRSSGKAPDRDSLDSSRYTVKPEARPAPKVEVPPPVAPAPKVDPTKAQGSNVKTDTGAPVATETVTAPPVAEPASEPPPTNATPPEMAEQMRDFLLGGSQQSIQEFKELLHPRDIRQNLVEVGVAAGLFYQDAASNFWHRRHFSYGPLISADAKLWLTPFLGFQGEFATSLAADMRGDPAGTRRIPADHQWWRGGILFRKSFGLDRKSPLLTIGVGFNEHRLNVPANDVDRIRTRLSGAAVSLGLQQPTSQTHFWEYGVQFLPRESEQEGKTGLSLRSGTKQETYSIAVWLGSRTVMDRKHQVYWQLSHTLDKTLYDGQASKTDPISGIQPAGVFVNTGTTMFRLGYTWAE